MKSHLIFADGSSLGNPGSSGWGAIVVREEREVTELGGGKALSTNNEMELFALCSALDELDREDGNVRIYTDSSYVINGATKWIHGWERNGWITSSKSPVLHQELWQSVSALLVKRKEHGKVEFIHVPGHSGVLGNERADEIATRFAAGEEVELYDGSLSAYAIDVLNIDIDPSLHESRVREKSRAKMKAFSYVSKLGDRVKVHSTWSECEARVKGKRGALFQKVFSKDEEDALVKKWSH